MPIGNGGIIGPANVPTLASAKGVWSLREAQLAQRQGIWPLGLIPDPYFEYTTLLLPGNGTNGATNNTFLDASTNNFTITRNGNTTQGTFSPFSQTGWGNYFNGTNAYLNLGNQTALHLGTSSYTVEMWLYKLANTQYMVTCGDLATGATSQWQILADVTGTKIAWGTNVFVLTSSATIPLNTWTHIAFVRNAATNTLSLYINGSLDSSVSNTDNYNASTSFYVGQTPELNASRYWNGYISNFRMVKGVAVYTGNFTVPTSPLTATQSAGTNIAAITTGQTSLLTCQSNRFVDNGQGNTGNTGFTITVNGSPSVQAFSPFNPLLPWTAANNGGSGYFDGTGDYLSVADNAALELGSSNFTIEFWYYPTSFVDATTLVTKGWSSSQRASWMVYNNGTAGTITFYGSSAGTSYDIAGGTQIGTAVLNAWNHVAISRSGSTIGLFLNGVRGNTVTSSASFWDVSTALTVSADSTGAAAAKGYMSSYRMVVGTAVYDPTQTTLTVPTAPLTAITNTSLLLNFTNAGIYDATSKNDLETVGNAQISTTQSKWGGSSVSFDGTGDWLLIPDQPIQRIGTGNFTVEGWVYRNSSGTYGLIGKGTGTTGWLLSLNSSNQVVFTYGSSTITSTGTVSATTWTHIAVVREGTSTNQTKIYINGTNDGTGTVSTDFNQTNSMYVGADRTGGSAANAYMQDVRVTNYARYTANFTAPTAAFPTL